MIEVRHKVTRGGKGEKGCVCVVCVGGRGGGERGGSIQCSCINKLFMTGLIGVFFCFF